MSVCDPVLWHANLNLEAPGLLGTSVQGFTPNTLYRELWGQVLFKVYRHLPRAKRVKPVMVHINYHPGAPARHTTPRTALACRRFFGPPPGCLWLLCQGY